MSAVPARGRAARRAVAHVVSALLWRAEVAVVRTIARTRGRFGELALREDGDHLELISNGVFLMDTRDGRSERLLLRAAVDAARVPVRRVLLGGLGLGFTLAEALAHPDIDDIVVLEVEPAVVDWNRDHAAAVTGGSVDAPGVRCVVADLVGWIKSDDAGTFDTICLDIDNGPDWLVDGANAWLYSDEGLTVLQQRLAIGGALSVWCAAPSPELEARLASYFGDVHHLDVEVDRGATDRVIVAR